MKFHLMVLPLMLCFVGRLEAQDCGECGQRTIYIHNFMVYLTAPVADHDSIMTFYDALMVTPAVTDYLNQNDPTKDCITTVEVGVPSRGSDSVWALSDPSVLTLLGSTTLPATMSENTDYYIKGVIVPFEIVYGGDNINWSLYSGPNEKLVTTAGGQLEPHPAGDVHAAVAAAMSSEFGPAMTRIRSFEIQEREKGAPYAIKPSLTLTSGKASLDFNEQTTVHISLIDCDGYALANRTVTLEAEGGTLDNTSITTDGNGTGDVIFTAGTTPQIAVITPTFSYKKPSDNPGQIDLDPLAIQIRKPTDCWFVQVKYKFGDQNRNIVTQSAPPFSSRQSDETLTQENIVVAAWIKGIVTVDPITHLQYFDSAPTTVGMKISGSRDESGTGNLLNLIETFPGGYVIEVTRSNAWATVVRTAMPDRLVAVGPFSFTVTFSNFDANQTGNSSLWRETYDPINGREDFTESTPADPSRKLMFSMTDATSDTSYTINEFTDIGAFHERRTETVTQTASWQSQSGNWEDRIFRLNRTTSYVLDNRYDTLGISDHHSVITDQSLKVLMYYNSPTTGIDECIKGGVPTEYSLGQNYPNPFNPTTVVSSQLPVASNVRLVIYDLLGREVSVLVNERRAAGSYEDVFDASELSSGVYIYRLTAGQYVESRKMILMR